MESADVPSSLSWVTFLSFLFLYHRYEIQIFKYRFLKKIIQIGELYYLSISLQDNKGDVRRYF